MAAAIVPEGIQDDKAQHVIPFILDILQRHTRLHAGSASVPPLIIGLSAPQGAGKSVLVSLLHEALASERDLPTTIFSLDDFYLPYEGLKELARANPSNPLLQHRGQPSTHDIPLVRKVFQSLRQNQPTKIPQFNKAAHQGFGDRVPERDWLEVNTDPTRPVRIVLFEGWCVGFRSLSEQDLKQQHDAACRHATAAGTEYQGRLGHNTLESVATINRALAEYDEITAYFDGLVHIEAAEPLFVYEWRKEQEHHLIKAKGSGMTDYQVKTFIDGYYPSYELYGDRLGTGIFPSMQADGLKDDPTGRQLRLRVGRDRKVIDVLRI